MILYELVNSEDHPVYQDLEISNGNRQYDFLRSIVGATLAMGRPFLSSTIIKALNYQAITCLHVNAGEYRPCPVHVGDYEPPAHFRVQALMDDFVNLTNRMWETEDPVLLSSFALWRMNNIHPFINGNGRTARATCYFVLCVKAGGWLPGATILPELIRRAREKYVLALKDADKSFEQGKLDLSTLQELLSKLLEEQIKSATSAAPHPPGNTADPAPNLIPVRTVG